MGPLKAMALKELMDQNSQLIPHPIDSAEGIRAAAQVGDVPQELQGVAFLLQRIILGAAAIDFELVDMNFPVLALAF
jgi:hypothetical protein